MGPAAAFGLGGALVVTLGFAPRGRRGRVRFNWGWRVPFLVSALLALSLWIRLRLHETRCSRSCAPVASSRRRHYREVFRQWRNLKVVLIALFSMMVAQGAVWYTTFFYSQFFVRRIVKVDPGTVNALMIGLVLVSAPLYLFFGWLSDRIGRKPVMLGGMIIMAVAIFPTFRDHPRSQPALVGRSSARQCRWSPIPGECALRFDPSASRSSAPPATSSRPCSPTAACPTSTSRHRQHAGAGAHRRGRRGVRGRSRARRQGARRAQVRSAAASGGTGRGRLSTLSRSGARRRGDGVRLADGARGRRDRALRSAAACLVELFPTRIRYTALSLPYHIGTGWVGGFLPATAYAMTVATGDIYFGLWYPTIAVTLSVIVTARCSCPRRGHRALDGVD